MRINAFTNVAKTWIVTFSVLVIVTLPINDSFPFAFIFAGEANGVDIVTHPIGYTGTGGALTIDVSIDPTSANAASMVIPVQNVVFIFNNLAATTGNLITGGSNNVPMSDIDFESVLLHEMGHSLGLAHVNLATESGLMGNDQNYTKSTDGADNAFDIGIGTDAVRGSSDDQRDDDVILNYFRKTNNNPFTIAGTVDNTTYSITPGDLPVGHDYSANADRDVGALLGVADTECVMQQGTFNDEAQRTLGHDDVAGLTFAMSGLDEMIGGGDDYTFTLNYSGMNTSGDIVIDFDNMETGFAVSNSMASGLNATHFAITSNNIYFNTGFSWFFNPVLLAVELIDFSVLNVDGNAQLNWITATETNHSHFEVQKSTNLQDWITLERVYTQDMEKEGLKYYSYSDRNFSNDNIHAYYRIKIVDLDGIFEYSEVQVLMAQNRQPKFIAFSPMPLQPSSIIEMEFFNNDEVDVHVYNIFGQLVRSLKFDGLKGINRFSVGEISDLTQGIYIYEIKVRSYRFVEKVIH